MGEETRQRALDALGILDTAPDERIDRVVRMAQEVFGVPMVSVSLIDRDRQWRKAQIGLGSDQTTPRESAFCDVTIRRPETLIVEDAARDVRFADNPYVVGDPHLRFYAGHPLTAPNGERIGSFCIMDTEPRRLDQHAQDLLQDMALWVQAELVSTEELEGATIVQRALLPTRTPEVPGYDLAARAVPAGLLLGDFYDWRLLPGRLRVTVADVMGKGAGPALVAATVRAALRAAPERPLVQAVAELDRALAEDFGGTGMFVTAVHGDIDLATGEISVVDAGHSLAFVLKADDTWVELRSTGLPLGMGFDEPRDVGRARLEPGDTFLCCSDGLLDILDPDDPFGHVRRVVRERGPAGAVEEAARLAAVGASDDVTVVIVQRRAQ